MAGVAREQGLEIVSNPEQADVVVVNTCAFIESAREESVDTLLEVNNMRGRGPLKTLVSAGCLSQRHGAEIGREMPEVDYVIGTGNPESLAEILKGTAKRIDVGPPGHFLQTASTPRFLEPGSRSAFVKLADGCSRKCAFCAIPGIRGKAHSRPLDDIVSEAESLAQRGIVELNLVAQDTSAYGLDLRDGTDLSRLLGRLDQVEQIRWIRLLYLYPDSVSDRLLDIIARGEKIVPYLDVPIQHASDVMLKRMRRGHGKKTLEALVTRARERIPNVYLRTAVLVGHPGETAEDFEQLLEFLAWARFDHLGAFRYSDEEGTPSFGTGPTVGKRDSYNRLRKVLALGRKISMEKGRRLRGKTVEVLIEDAADEDGFVLKGRHRGQAPEVDGCTYVVSTSARLGEMVSCRVTESDAFDLVAEAMAESD